MRRENKKKPRVNRANETGKIMSLNISCKDAITFTDSEKEHMIQNLDTKIELIFKENEIKSLKSELKSERFFHEYYKSLFQQIINMGLEL